LSVYGFSLENNEVVSSVWPGYGAEKAGLKTGDVLDMPDMPVSDRAALFDSAYAFTLSPGTTFTMPFYHDGVRRTITMVSQPMRRSAAENVSDVVLIVSQSFFVVIAAALVLLRPSRMTWAFFIFSLGQLGGSGEIGARLTVDGVIALSATVRVLSIIGPACFVSFALRFPTDIVRGWRRTLEVSVFSVASVLAAFAASTVVRDVLTGRIFPFEESIAANYGIAASLVALFAFFATYAAATAADRQRIRWVLFGLIVGFSAAVLTSLPAINATVWLWNVAHTLNVVLPITLAYAIVRHRVIDVNFLISRAIVYAGITGIIVIVFGVIDWFFNHYLALRGAGIVAEVGTAVALGFWLQGLHARVDGFIDAVFFRRRHEAEVRIKRLARALPHASNMDTVADGMVDRPADALELTSAALFVRDESGSYACMRAKGWEQPSSIRIDGDDLLLIQLAAELQPISLYRADYDRRWMPEGAAHPALAMPVSVRNDLRAFALYGPHQRGDDLDPDEVSVLNSLSVAASSAMDHVEAAELRRKIENVGELEREVEALRAQVAIFRSALA